MKAFGWSLWVSIPKVFYISFGQSDLTLASSTTTAYSLDQSLWMGVWTTKLTIILTLLVLLKLEIDASFFHVDCWTFVFLLPKRKENNQLTIKVFLFIEYIFFSNRNNYGQGYNIRRNPYHKIDKLLQGNVMLWCVFSVYISDHGCQINKDCFNAKVQFFK